jgi:hypothetical protein
MIPTAARIIMLKVLAFGYPQRVKILMRKPVRC